jgi:hypothetical protein
MRLSSSSRAGSRRTGRPRTGPAGRGADRPRRAGRSIRRRSRARRRPSRVPPPSWPRRGRVRGGPLGECGSDLDRERVGGDRSCVRERVTTMSPTAGASARIMPATRLSPATANHGGRGGVVRRARWPAPERPLRCARRRAARAAHLGARAIEASATRARGRPRRRADRRGCRRRPSASSSATATNALETGDRRRGRTGP